MAVLYQSNHNHQWKNTKKNQKTEKLWTWSTNYEFNVLIIYTCNVTVKCAECVNMICTYLRSKNMEITSSYLIFVVFLPAIILRSASRGLKLSNFQYDEFQWDQRKFIQGHMPVTSINEQPTSLVSVSLFNGYSIINVLVCAKASYGRYMFRF